MLILILAIIPNLVMAQNIITGFWGMKFGDKDYIAIDLVKKIYPNAIWDKENKQIYCKDVELGTCPFDQVFILFSKSQLYEATFIKVIEQAWDATTFKNVYSMFVNKYGDPISKTSVDNSIVFIWKDGNNTLELHHDDIGNPLSGIAVRYRSSTYMPQSGDF